VKNLVNALKLCVKTNNIAVFSILKVCTYLFPILSEDKYRNHVIPEVLCFYLNFKAENFNSKFHIIICFHGQIMNLAIGVHHITTFTVTIPYDHIKIMRFAHSYLQLELCGFKHLKNKCCH